MIASNPSLLLVDDDVAFVRAAAEIARLDGFHITIAGSVAQARNRLQGGEFDIVFIDLTLPDAPVSTCSPTSISRRPAWC